MTTKPAMPELPEPEAYIFQHEETGNTMFVDRQQVEWGFEKNNPRLQKVGKAYTADQMRAYALAALQSAQPAAAASDEEIRRLGRHGAWRYKYSSDPAHSSTYKFNDACLLQFARAILALRPQSAQQAVPMTEEQIVAALKACDREDPSKEGWIWRTRIKWARAIEAHHGITAQGAQEWV